MTDLDKLVETFETTHSQSFPKSGGNYQGNPWNFFSGFDNYRTDIRNKSIIYKIEDKLEQLKEEQKALPWE